MNNEPHARQGDRPDPPIDIDIAKHGLANGDRPDNNEYGKQKRREVNDQAEEDLYGTPLPVLWCEPMWPTAFTRVNGNARNQRNLAVTREMCDQFKRRKGCRGTTGPPTTAARSRVGATY